jgi:acyl CoA:acetate/3-ketoacid CoA transferase
MRAYWRIGRIQRAAPNDGPLEEGSIGLLPKVQSAFGSDAVVKTREDAMMARIKSYISFESEALAVATLALLFCVAVILGFL